MLAAYHAYDGVPGLILVRNVHLHETRVIPQPLGLLEVYSVLSAVAGALAGSYSKSIAAPPCWYTSYTVRDLIATTSIAARLARAWRAPSGSPPRSSARPSQPSRASSGAPTALPARFPRNFQQSSRALPAPSSIPPRNAAQRERVRPQPRTIRGTPARPARPQKKRARKPGRLRGSDRRRNPGRKRLADVSKTHAPLLPGRKPLQ